jgi:hypothetical protein
MVMASGEIIIASNWLLGMAGGHKNIKEVRATDESQALHVFRSQMQDASNKKGAADLVCALDCVPIAITQAAALINRRRGAVE